MNVIQRIGIVGAGTMGSGIALVALTSGYEVVLQDVYEPTLEKARAYLQRFLAKKGQEDRFAQVTFTTSLDLLAQADVVIEAALEKIEVKQDIFTRLEQVCRPDAILATNTSTLSVTAVAGSIGSPHRVAGMHFFNPAPVLPLVEVIQGLRTHPDVVAALVDLARSMGKTPVQVQDTPGFIVNRVARPFYGEALRLLGEGVASFEVIDQVVQLGGGFRMGPFRLMDLIGIDVNATAMQSMFDQSFGEPRYRPHGIQIRMMASRALGYKVGEGFYNYHEDAPPPAMPVPPEIRDNAGTILFSPGTFAPGLAELVEKSGYVLMASPLPEVSPLLGIVAAGRAEGLKEQVLLLDATLPQDVPLLVQCADISLSEVAGWLENPERLVGFDGLFLHSGAVATLVDGGWLLPEIKEKATDFFAGLGRLSYWIPDSPGLLLPRIICMLVNEGAFAVLEKVADPATIDLAMRLGVNYPEGPLASGEKLGFSKVLAVLDYLYDEYHEDRYRACVLLRRWARLEAIPRP